MLRHETKARKEGFRLIIGVDEAGRGPLAGPVVAGAVALNTVQFRNKICDSKKLSETLREKAFHEIFQNGRVGVGIVSETAIDTMNIAQATYHAMSAAVSNLIAQIPVFKNKDSQDQVLLLVDGKVFKTTLPYSYRTIVSGDSLSLSIASASIVAKVTRDRILNAYDKIFPEYGFKKHKGYSTRIHRETIKKFGPSLIHRRTFSWT